MCAYNFACHKKDTFRWVKGTYGHCTAEQGNCQPRLSRALCTPLAYTFRLRLCVTACVYTHVGTYCMHTQHMQLSAHHSTVYQVHAAPLDLSMTSDLHELSGGPVGPSSLPGITYTSSAKKKKKHWNKDFGVEKHYVCVCLHGGGRAWGRDFLLRSWFTHTPSRCWGKELDN